jgi:tetratricopeptide (TPR) repeat protein
MARLRHPNVVVVHDVGVVEGRVFVAMEFVEGTTLSRWLLDDERSLPAILEVMRGAGAGLAAAHRAGLVHRDFKPDNVLVGGDGTVVVTDFGLARALDTAEPVAGPGQASSSTSHATSSVGILASPLTVSGAMIGTPAYMAPEQFERGDPGPAADQFSFCVALHQAVYGVRPFAAASIAELVASVTQGRVVDPPQGRRIPSWLRRLILRGLAVDPRQRWPSMDVLLDRLARNPSGRQRQIAALVGAAALAGTIGVLAAKPIVQPAAVPSDPCPRADDELAQVWDDAKREAVRSAFAATNVPYAATTIETVVGELDEYAVAWLDSRQAACRATRVDGTQSETLLDLRMACLDRRLNELAVRVEALAAVDTGLIERAVEFVDRLVPVDVCADQERLASTALRPEDPAQRTEVDALIAELDRVDAQLAAGKIDDALVEHARALVARADAIGHEATRAEASYRLARVYYNLERPKDAREQFERTLAAAAAGRHDRLAAVTWIDLVALVGDDLDRPEEASTLGQSAELAVARDGNRPDQRATLATNLGTVMRLKGDFAKAIELHTEAVELRRTLYGDESLQVASALNNLGNAYNSSGDLERGLGLLEQSLAIRRRAYGDSHPRVAEAINNIGVSLHGMGRFADALARFEESHAVRRALWGDDHPLVVSTLNNIGGTLSDLERHAEAEVVQRRALATLEKLYGADSSRLALALNNLANTLDRRNRYDEALVVHQRALALRRKHDGERTMPVAMSLTNIGVTLESLGRTKEAREHFERALAIIDAIAPDHPDSVHALVRLAELALADAKPLKAGELASRVVGINETTKAAPIRRAEAEFVLARARWDTGDHRRAVEHAERARTTLQGAGGHADFAEEIAAWLAIHVP